MKPAGWWTVAGLLFLIPAVAFLVEGALITAGRPAITQQVRMFSASHDAIAFVIALFLFVLYTIAVGALIFHLFLYDKLDFLR